ncbi:MAG: periplasmic heavy metal sensor [Nitrospirae bacterium]|nr:periplasmic heavy metal sensor [Nitrospirota bacterium]
MEKRLAALVLIVAMSLCSMGYAYDVERRGDRTPRHTLLTQLPADKETLFHQTMREVREKTANIREQIKQLKAEINDILIAPEFDEALFFEKTKRVQELHQIMREAKDEAIVKLAQKFTQEERKILAKLISQKHRHHGRPPAR